MSAIDYERIEGLRYNGVQRGIPGYPDEVLFTEMKHKASAGATFNVPLDGITIERIVAKREEVRLRFKRVRTPR